MRKFISLVQAYSIRLFTATLAVAMVFTFSCSIDDDNNNGGSTIEYGSLEYGGQTYKTVKIGNQTWMAENLNYKPNAETTSECYSYSNDNCATYGRLYNWRTAMDLPSSCSDNECAKQIQSKHKGICPSGWHIPSKAEWEVLSNYVQKDKVCNNCDAKFLKTTSGWNFDGNGTNAYGFSAQPGGWGKFPNFFDMGGNGNWWSSSEYDAYGAYARNMNPTYDYTDWDTYSNKMTAFSIRCLKNDDNSPNQPSSNSTEPSSSSSDNCNPIVGC